MKKINIQTNSFLQVIHLDGAFVKSKNQQHSKSTIEFDLYIQTNTKLKVIKSRGPIYATPSVSKDVTITSIEESVKHHDLIRTYHFAPYFKTDLFLRFYLVFPEIVGFLKNKIKETSISASAKINQGCLSDCLKYKLEVRMPASLDLNEFHLGSHIKVTGIMKYSNGGHPYIWVTDANGIILESNEVRKLPDLLKGTKIPKRIKDESFDNNSKRLKSE